jgi:phosphoribosylamine--glycine ligase
MISPQGAIKVLEFNCRFGDPETQPIMMRLKTDLTELCLAALESKLDSVQAEWDPRPALGVVLAAGGYPADYRKGDAISGLAAHSEPDAKVFVAGARAHDGQIVTSGGRVLCACALGEDVAAAQRKAYELVGSIHWEGMYYRKDIGHRAINRG